MANETKKPVSTHRPIRLAVVHPEGAFDGEVLHPKGTVFEWYEPGLPPDDVAVPVDDSVALGAQPEPPPSKEAPPYTTKGYVDQANRKHGRRAKAKTLTT